MGTLLAPQESQPSGLMMLEFNPDLPPMAAPPSLPRQQARYARILDVAAG